MVQAAVKQLEVFQKLLSRTMGTLSCLGQRYRESIHLYVHGILLRLRATMNRQRPFQKEGEHALYTADSETNNTVRGDKLVEQQAASLIRIAVFAPLRIEGSGSDVRLRGGEMEKQGQIISKAMPFESDLLVDIQMHVYRTCDKLISQPGLVEYFCHDRRIMIGFSAPALLPAIMSRIPKSLRPRLPRVGLKPIAGLDAEIDTPRPSNADLAQLVRDNNIHGARRVWLHLNALRIPVDRNTVYVQAALFHLENPYNRGAITSDMLFIDWLKLVPSRHQAPEWQKPFKPILEQLLRNSSPKDNALLLVRFAVLAASKGYLHDIWQPVMSTMLRLPKPENASFYLKKLEDAAVEYDKKYTHTETTAAMKYRAIHSDTTSDEEDSHTCNGTTG
ncbi:hypothetical protein CYLTODRAFT_408860 [Cylindrobasidium torrendii FP15055 ss-10]|uniref:Uncharacterized protein n=1 Tax=Cylindrobasidium torrendii FP15055 ss-10 TaxID=1314674 RepID=A0A0D7BLM9_9AGAR|nr:hypothetical protein CYLTODRAFT_408860 [Cylindrobasidium torrendii FP15055 ss-10]